MAHVPEERREEAPEIGAADGESADDGSAAVGGERPYRPRRGRARVGRWLGHLGRAGAILIGFAILALAAAIFLFTQTDTGRLLVADFIQSELDEAIEGGRVTFGPIVGGNLINRVVVERLEIADRRGQTFVRLDSVHAEYDPIGFLRGDFTFRRMDAARAEIRLLQDRDGVWNFDRIFPEDPDPEAEPDDLRLVVHDARLAAGRLLVRMPFLPGEEGPAREAEVAAALGGETIWRLEAVEEGADQVIELGDFSGRFPLIRVVDPEYPMRIEMERVRGTLRAVTQPLEVRRFDGVLVVADTIRTAIRELELPDSYLSGVGWVVSGDPVSYRFDLEAEPASFTDLQWLPLPVPAEGGGPMDIVFRSDAETPVLEIREADVRVRDSHLRGGFAVALRDPPGFESMDLLLDPLRLRLVDELLERPTAMDGYVRGRLQGQGPITSLRLEAELALRDLEPVVQPPEAVSRVRLQGRAGLLEPYRFDGLTVELQGFEPRWLTVAATDPEIGGRLDGTLALDGRPDGQLSFRADLAHARADLPTSRLTGQGWVRAQEDPPVLDVRLTVDPLALALLDPFVPDLQLEGLVRGPLEARGSLSDLLARADLATERGELEFDGRFDLVSEEMRYDAELVAREVDLRQWSRAAPETRLAVRGRVAGRGTDPETARARFDLEVLPSEVAEARVDTSIFRFSVADGLASVDTFAVATDVGRVHGRGSFGLVERVGGALVVDVEVEDLSSWNRWVVEGWTPDGPADVTDDLFADFPPFGPRDPDAAEEALPDSLSGSLYARGAVYGNVHGFSLGGRLDGRRVAWGPFGADSLYATVDALGPVSPDSFLVNARAYQVSLPIRDLDSLALRVERVDAGRALVRLAATADTLADVVAGGAVAWGEDDRREVELETLRLELGRQLLVLRDSAFLAFGGDEMLSVRDLVLTGPGGAWLEAEGVLPREGEVSFDLEARNLSFREFLQLMPEPPDVDGRLNGLVRVRGTADEPLVEAELRVDEPGMGEVTYRSLDGQLEYAGREIRGSLALEGHEQLLARAEGLVRAHLSLRTGEARLLEDAFDFRVRADSMPLALLDFALGGMEEVGGFARTEVRVTGSPGSLGLSGDASVRGATAWVPDLGVRFIEGQGRARFQGSSARIDSFTVASGGGGSILIAGDLDLADPSDPAFDVDVRARRLRAMDRRPMRFLVNGRGHLAGTYTRPVLTGRFRISNGEFRQDELLRRHQVVDLTDPDIYALIDTATVGERRLLEQIQNPFMQNMHLDVAIDVGPDLWLRSDEMNVEIAGEDLVVEMDRAAQMLTVVGEMRLVRGTYRFTFGPYTQELRIAEGTIEFVGTPGIDPNLNIAAEYRTRTREGPVVIRAVVGGTLQQTELALESDPPLSESDQLCFLAVGSPCMSAVDQGFGERIAREGALGILGAQITQAIAADLGLDYLTLRTTGVGVEEGREEADGFFAGAFAGTEVEFGRYLGRDIFVTVTQPLGTGQLPGWSVEWRFADDWTLEARAENRFQRRFAQVVGSTLETEQTYGLFLFREWSF